MAFRQVLRYPYFDGLLGAAVPTHYGMVKQFGAYGTASYVCTASCRHLKIVHVPNKCCLSALYMPRIASARRRLVDWVSRA
jgi:hypothetical protein